MSSERKHLFLHSTAVPLSPYHLTATTNFAHIMNAPGANMNYPQDELIEEAYESPFLERDRTLQTSNAPSSVTLRLVGDVVVAVTVTALAAPFLTIIDKALVQRSAALANPSNAASMTVWSSMRSTWTHMVQHPIQFVRSPTYLWMWGTYAVTYAAANTLRTMIPSGSTETYRNSAPRVTHRTMASRLDTNADLQQRRRPLRVWWSGGAALLLGTSIVNSSASVLKDRAYARLYGNTSTVTSSVPKITYGLWILRDLTVIGAAFVLPTHVARFWQQQYSGPDSEYRYRPSDATILRISQIATPVIAQVVAGPLHFVGLDCYNRNLSHLPSLRQKLVDRWLCLRGSLGQVITARMMRIIPGYGIAGVLNTELRNQWEAKVVVPSASSNNTGWGQRKNGYRVGAWSK